MKLDEMVEAIRNFPGVTRKNAIRDVVEMFPTAGFAQVFAAEGEDAAALDVGDQYVLLATDGIMESLVERNPYYAGYFSVLVNVNDIAAMGGRCLGMVDVMSMTAPGAASEVVRGMKEGVRKFGVPIVGGHTHPDCHYNAVDIAIVGKVAKGAVLLSSTAVPGDDVVFVMDLEGFYPEDLPNAYVTTVDRSDEIVQAQMEAVAKVAESGWAHSCKDMSNPGHVGTLGMMMECSGTGARIDVSKIPIPDGVDDVKWALSYQGCGFVFACDPSDSQKVIDEFSKVGCTGAVVGKVDGSRRLVLVDGGEERVLFDFEKDIITGICRKDL